MKSAIQNVVRTAALCTVGICITMSAASANMVKNEFHSQHYDVVISHITIASSINALSQESMPKAKPFTKIFDQQQPRIPLSEQPVKSLKRPNKKNEFFALATLFNDKLQQLLASFNDASVKPVKKEQIAHANAKNKTCNAKRT